MLEFFKRNTFFSLLLLIPYGAVLHIGPFLVQQDHYHTEQTWVFNQIFGHWAQAGGMDTHVLSILLICFQSGLIAFLVSKFKLLPEGQLFPSIIFILLIGIHPRSLEFQAILLSNVFLILAIFQLLQIYQKKKAAIYLFNFGAFVAVATLFYTPNIFFLINGLIGLIILRGFKPRELFQLLGGFGNVFLLSFLILYILHWDNLFFEKQFTAVFSPFIFSMKFQNYGWVALGIILLLIILSISQYSFFQLKRNIAVQKIFDLMFWWLLAGFISICFVRIDNPAHMITIMPPLAILCGTLLTKVKNPLIAETIHLFLVMICLFLQFQSW